LTVEESSGGLVLSASDNMSGYRLGAGVEASYGKAFGRIEYRYSDYGRLKFQDIATDIDVRRHQVVVGIGYRF
jgi:outer membrane immunogenic protein